ncbi:unnamed protein product, partial [Symbiodinium sp. CCMP2456]
MVYDCSPTQLTLALIPTFAGLLHRHLASSGTEMLPGKALRDLEVRVQALAIMTKDQLMCLAAELLPPEGVRTLMQHLSVLHGYGEWEEIRRRRRRALMDLSLTYLAAARLQSGAFAAQAQHLHTFDIVALERETYIGAYTARLLVEPFRTQYLESTEEVRGRFFAQDRTLNLAAAEWEVQSSRLQAQQEDSRSNSADITSLEGPELRVPPPFSGQREHTARINLATKEKVTRKRQTKEVEGGDPPPAAKAKSGDAPSGSSSSKVDPAPRYADDPQFLEAVNLLASEGYSPYPPLQAGCEGSIRDLNVHRVSVAVTKQLREGLSEVTAPSPRIASSLMATFLASRAGLYGENLAHLLGKPEQEDAGWFRFPYSSPNKLAKKGEKAFHGTHLECLHGIMATGRILPSSSVLEGTRHFEGRPGVYLHKEINRHLAAGYASLTRYGPKHVFMRAMLEVLYDIDGSQKKGKQTNQLILAYDSVQITA